MEPIRLGAKAHAKQDILIIHAFETIGFAVEIQIRGRTPAPHLKSFPQPVADGVCPGIVDPERMIRSFRQTVMQLDEIDCQLETCPHNRREMLRDTFHIVRLPGEVIANQKGGGLDLVDCRGFQGFDETR